MKIVCLGKNYQAHAQEMRELLGDITKPVVFLKPPSALLFEPEPIRLPDYSTHVHHEIELVIEIGQRCKKVAAAAASEVIRGFRVGLDLTARDLQQEAKRHGWPWALGKGSTPPPRSLASTAPPRSKARSPRLPCACG